MQLISAEDPKDFQKGYLSLPFDGDQLHSFIKGLLGTPQTITRNIWGCFEIHLKDLQNFHELIDQRVTQQNNGKLIQLKTQIYYSDESSVILSSLEELLTYNEVKPVISEAIRMTWVYLIQFADKNVPERQEIEVTITTDSKIEYLSSSDRFIKNSMGQFGIIIKHTARTWGNDIESLITNQINSILIKSSKFREHIHKYSGKIGLVAGLIVFGSSIIGIYLVKKGLEKAEMISISKFLKVTTNLGDKIDFMLKYIGQDQQGKQSIQIFIFTILSIIISIFLGTWVEGLASNKKKSHLVMTREAKNYRDQSVKAEDKTFVLFWISLIASILTGLLSSYIYKWISAY
jgi:hypothetical protein